MSSAVITTSEAATIAGVSRGMIWRLKRAGRIAGIRGVVKEKSLRAWMADPAQHVRGRRRKNPNIGQKDDCKP